MVARETHGEIVRHSKIGSTLEDEVPAFGNVEVDIARGTGIDIRPACMHAYRAANRVAPEQEALRSTQDLGAIDVKQTRNS